ncbi:unnamed protein product [Phytophthora fragariaefolia]|uniref:Unnamed protein product n=1 Tax=Phytophthora fragariaefolia TaxID=1490495 RepID=A0A9W6UDF1_9STRA|nr:unnamed protein product [Phytophthora fragariaefolia]
MRPPRVIDKATSDLDHRLAFEVARLHVQLVIRTTHGRCQLFSMLVVDAVGPLPLTERGNKYILVFVDYFTRWAEAFAVIRLDSVTFVEVTVNGVVARHGVPSRLLSDYGRNFTSEIAKSFYQTLGIKKLCGSAYHPQTQGLRLGDRVAVQYEIGDPVWVYQLFRKKRGESRTKKLAFSWHGPYRVVGKIGENAYRIDIPAHPDKVVTVNVNRLKTFRGRWTRPNMDEVPEGVEEDGEEVEDGPLEEADLPPSSFAERVTIARGDTALLGVTSPLLEIVARRVVNRAVEYLVLTANYESHWVPRADVMPEYGELVTAFEQAERKKRHLPELRRSSRLEEATAEVKDDDLLMA